jgi:1-phosphatidylinositol-4-phosphate 5-kinase
MGRRSTKWERYVINKGIKIGEEIWPDGSGYSGMFILGKKNGIGRYKWNNGSEYIGEWEDNHISGLV